MPVFSFEFRDQLYGDWDTAKGFLVEQFDRLYAGLAVSPASVTATTTVVTLPSTATPSLPAYTGGTSTEGVQSPTPTWVPADGTTADPGWQVILDTVARGTTSVTVTCRIRAKAGTVQARLRNVTDGITVGLSSVVASTTYQTVSFVATLTVGVRTYQLELLPSLANTTVSALWVIT